MSGRWLFVRIRSAERALREGRIDEAYALALQPDVREHRRGQKLLDELAKPLLARARLHLQAGRWRAALDAIEQLQTIDRMTTEADDLRRHAADEFQQQNQRDAGRQVAVERAAADLAAGRLESGRLAIDRIDDSQRRDDLREQLDIRVQRSAQLLAQADEALQRADVLTALRFWSEARERHGRTEASDAIAPRLARACRNTLDEWFTQGRLERFLAARDSVGLLRPFDPTLDEYEKLAGLCARGAAQLGARDYAGLRETAVRLRAARGNIGWIDTILAALGELAEAHETVLASPLGLCAGSIRSPGSAGPVFSDQRADARGATDVPGTTGATLGLNALLLLVDGAGSSLLVAHDRVRIGRAGGSSAVEVPIPADLQSHHADIVRDGEDYYLTAYGPVRVNQGEVKRTRLADGDRIYLGPAAKLVFRRPSGKSDTAVLKLSHRSRLPQDVSDVVLFRETCLIGPQASCHIRTPDGNAQVVLFDRAGRLYGRETTARGGKLGDPRPLPLGATLDFGDVRVTIKAYEAQETNRRA